MGYPARRQKGNFSEALSRFSARFPSSVAGHRNVLRAPCGATDNPARRFGIPALPAPVAGGRGVRHQRSGAPAGTPKCYTFCTLCRKVSGFAPEIENIS